MSVLENKIKCIVIYNAQAGRSSWLTLGLEEEIGLA